MINFTFQKEISDIPMILPIEMFIVEENTAAPEFVEEINEIVPTMQEEAVEEVKENLEEDPISQPIIEELVPEIVQPEVKEVIPEISDSMAVSETEEVLVDNSSNQANEFVIEEVPSEKKKRT